jgi:C_GCAxxG_C_C family probable redox protein
MLTAEQINKGFTECIHCSQQVLMEWAEKLGYDREKAARMAAPFGGGMFRGDTCGAGTGAMIAIGMKYGHSKPGDAEGNAALMEKVETFQKEFIARNGSTICRELVGHDFSQKGELEKAMENGKVFEICPKMVQSSLDILNKMM